VWWRFSRRPAHNVIADVVDDPGYNSHPHEHEHRTRDDSYDHDDHDVLADDDHQESRRVEFTSHDDHHDNRGRIAGRNSGFPVVRFGDAPQ
jgi:hypothetical protein